MNKNILILTAIIVGSIIVGIAISTLSSDNSNSPNQVDNTDKYIYKNATVERSDNSNSSDKVVNNTGKYIYMNATVESIEIMVLESFPVQIKVNAIGYLPDACTKIDGITKERDGNTFLVTIKTVRPADTFCTGAIVPFQEMISLDVYGLKAGIYNVNVNGVKGTFELEIDNIIQS